MKNGKRKENRLGDKGGKKDKDKSKKQKQSKQRQRDKKKQEKQDRQQKKTPWEESGFNHSQTPISDDERRIYAVDRRGFWTIYASYCGTSSETLDWQEF